MHLIPCPRRDPDMHRSHIPKVGPHTAPPPPFPQPRHSHPNTLGQRMIEHKMRIWKPQHAGWHRGYIHAMAVQAAAQEAAVQTHTIALLNLAAIIERADEQVLPAVYLYIARSLKATPTQLGTVVLCRCALREACPCASSKVHGCPDIVCSAVLIMICGLIAGQWFRWAEDHTLRSCSCASYT